MSAVEAVLVALQGVILGAVLGLWRYVAGLRGDVTAIIQKIGGIKR